MTYFRDGFGGFHGFGEDDPTGMGRALADALQRGDAVAAKYLEQAKAYYNKISASGGNKSDAEIAQHFFLQGASVLEGGMQYLQQANIIGGDVAKKAANAFAAARDGIQAGFHLGSGEGGTLDKIKDVDTLIKSTITIANSLGANEETTMLIQKWSSVATGCAAMITSAGPVWGGIGCAASAVFTALSMRAPAVDTTPEGVPYAQLVLAPNVFSDRPEITQSTIVARDAMLLASVLRHHYGLTSSTPLYEALTWSGNMPHVGSYSTFGGLQQVSESAPSGTSVWGRTVEVFNNYAPFLDKGSAKPAVDLTSMLLAVSALDRTELVGWHQTQGDLIEIARRVCDGGDWDEACHCDWDENGAGPCGAKLQASHEHQLALGYYASKGMMNQAGIATGASIGRGRIAAQQPVGSLLPFIRVDELINYFFAISLNTRRQDSAAWQLETKRFLQPATPLRFHYIPPRSKGQLWTYTNIMCAPGQCGSPKVFYVDPNRSAAEDLYWRLAVDPAGTDVEAQREYAALRLMAAMSYLIWMERADRLGSTEGGPADLIVAGPQDAPLSVAWMARMPIDPRQVVQTAPGVYVPNKFGNRHPWDVGLGAEIKKHPWDGAPSNWTTTAGVHFGGAFRSHSTRDGRWLHEWIKQREAYYRNIIAEARRAALVAFEGGGRSVQIALPSRLQQTTVLGAQIAMQPQLQQMLAVGALKTKSQIEQDCIAGGGYIATDGLCKPSAATEAACRASGGTPTWNEYELFRCPGSNLTLQQLAALAAQTGAQQVAAGQAPTPGGLTNTGGGIGSIALIAGAALLLTKFMK